MASRLAKRPRGETRRLMLRLVVHAGIYGITREALACALAVSIPSIDFHLARLTAAGKIAKRGLGRAHGARWFTVHNHKLLPEGEPGAVRDGVAYPDTLPGVPGQAQLPFPAPKSREFLNGKGVNSASRTRPPAAPSTDELVADALAGGLVVTQCPAGGSGELPHYDDMVAAEHRADIDRRTQAMRRRRSAIVRSYEAQGRG